tara:strand:+ start:4309 stop:5640 length:1332 start_codon:yes stop_codon:yes gene_type:complete
MRKRLKILFLTISFCSYSLSLRAQKKWSLQDCIERSIEKNISIKQAEIDLIITKEDKKTAIGNFLPTINLGATHSWNAGLNQNITTGILENMTTRSGIVNANVGIDLFKGLQNIQQLYRSNLSILANQYQLANMKEDIALLVANSYLQILFNKENLTMQELQLNIANEELLFAKERLKSGIIPKVDVLAIEANVATMEQQLLSAKNNYILSKISLAQLLLLSIHDFEIKEVVSLKENLTILNTDVKTIYEAALTNRNDIKLAKTNLKIAKKDLSISKGALLPTLSGFYSYNSRVLFDTQISFSNQFDLNAGENYGIQLSIPVFNNMYNNTIVRKSKLAVKKTEYALNQIKLDLENTVNQAYTDANGSFKAFQAAEKTLVAQKLAYEYAKERFNNGGLNAFNFLESRQRYESAQSELIKSKYDYLFKLKVLEFYFGIPNIYFPN